MNNRLLMSVAAAALIVGTGFANAQAGMSREAPAAAAAPSSSAPSADRAAPAERSAPMNRDEATDSAKRPDTGTGMKATQSDDKVQRDNGAKRATDSTRDNAQKPAAAQANDMKAGDAKAGKDMKAEGRDSNPNAKAAAESKSTTTTGQAGAGAKLSTEQRTKITTVIKQQSVQPVTNVNFAISVGTKVPRTVSFHPLPAEIVTIYPDWRGYEFFLVRNEIIVVNPRTLEIVAVLDA
ncbi:hypothetical protein V1282_000670 [Nitrobacteraceae bacterium AZCC 2146]